MTKYDVPDGHWDEEDGEPDPNADPVVEVDYHTVRIIHYREHRNSDLQDHEWHFSIDGGTIVGVWQGHRLGDSNQFDPMGGTWADVPDIVRRFLANELGVVEIEEHVDFDSAGVTGA